MPATLPETDLDYLTPVAPKRARWIRRLLGARFLFVSITIHLLLGLFAVVWVVQSYSAARKLTFKAGPPSPNRSTRAIEHKVQMAKKQQTMSAPSIKRIVSTGLAKVALPAMPAMPTTAAQPSKMAGTGGTGLGAMTGPMGAATNETGGGVVSLFGLRVGGGLAGTFYDLKQTRDGKPTDMAVRPGEKDGWDGRNEPENKPYDDVVLRLIGNGMGDSALNGFFRGPETLFTTQIFIPTMPADNGPAAFHLAGKVQPKRWLVLYQGRVTTPESGNYRFVGFGDDILLVHLNGRIVFDGSLTNPTKDLRKTMYHLEGMPPKAWTPIGQTFEVTAGHQYPIEILIGERPGGEFGVFLLLEKVGSESPQPNNVKLPIFKMAPSETPKGGKLLPVVAPDTSWSVWHATSNASSLTP